MRGYRAVLAPLALFLGILPGAQAQQRQARPDSYGRGDDAAPVVDVWLDQYTYTSGQRIRAYFDSDNGAYVTVVRVTTDGRLYVLYPRRPDQQRRYASTQRDNNEVPFSNEAAYYINEPQGTGFVFAIASFDRFDYTRYAWGSQWRDPRLTTTLADPFAVVNSFVSQTLDVRSAYTFDYEQYEVVRGGRYAGRYRYGNRFYGDDAYLSCVNYFGIGADYYCHSYGIIYGAPVLIGRTTPSGKPRATPKSMTIRPLVPDPMLPAPEHVTPPEKNDRAGTARVSGKMLESLRRSDRPRPEPIVRGYEPSVRSEPVQTQRLEPRPEPRVISPEPRVFREQPRYEAPRVEHRVEQPRVETPRVEVRQPESRPAPRVEKHQKDQ
ncbi:MAG TPA: DUF4384 domain-containing protein [Gemmatimonadaceae bacterium]|jgi:hypothetical protein